MKNITILGSSGSIGTQSLSVIEENEDLCAYALSVNKNIKLLEEQVRKFKPKYACVTDEEAAKSFKIAVSDTDTKVLSGKEGLEEIASLPKADTVVTAIVGIAGLLPTMEAIKAKKRIALANKETLVTAGDIVMKAAKENGAEIIPVDSEHSAIFQSLGERYKDGKNKAEVKNIILTASGGPFFGKTKEELKNVGVKEALKHPNWSMGAKITIDSATLMNKGLEVIEATHLFGVGAERVKVLVHRQSIVHSMVELTDNAVIAQLGSPDMKLPIQYAITYPERKPMKENELDLAEVATLTFQKPDLETFKCLALAFDAIKKGGAYPVVLNGANEACVDLFLKEKIGFLDIADLIEKALSACRGGKISSIDDVISWDRWSREYILKQISN
ncbi:MAG: 1-deoxy-D-xylulose-5-phosphate reductoisomerase [Clostridia bacterium]|nr:1-deoxy-D-xylulose-5-phosphate reductoisomerase [Clostridia bacterium]